MAEQDYNDAPSRNNKADAQGSKASTGKINVPIMSSSLSTGMMHKSPGSSSTSAMPKRDLGKDSC